LIPNFKGRKKQNPPQNPKPKNTQLFLPAAWACYLWVLSCMRLELISKTNTENEKKTEDEKRRRRWIVSFLTSQKDPNEEYLVPVYSHKDTHTHTHHNEWEREREKSVRETVTLHKTIGEVWYWTQWTNWLDSLGWQKLALLTYS
jgi:hypothetical protein